MDQIKIGRFIAEKRKAAGLTQSQLAEKLDITDRAVSKWETGRSLPDSSIMLELCAALKITVNDLLSGEVVTVDNYNRELENNLIEMIQMKEQADRRLLSLEIFIGVLVSVILFAMVFVAAFVQLENWLRVVLIITGFIVFLIGIAYALRIEQTAGYYACSKCGHRYVPEYRSVLFAPHINRTRRMRCPKCGVRSWQKKVLSRD